MSTNGHIDGRTVGIGTLAGLAAYAFGYVLTYVTQRDRVEESLGLANPLLELFGGRRIPPEQVAGWLFYNAHFVDTELPSLGGTRVVNFVARAEGGSISYLYVVPPLLLVLAGVAAAAATGSRSPADGGLAGATVAVGYLAAAVVGLVAFAYPIGDGIVRPDPVTATLLAGLAYPLLFGATGGLIAGTVADPDRTVFASTES